MSDFTDRTGFSEYIGVHDRDYSSSSGKLAYQISERIPELEKQYISGGRIAAELNIVINKMKVGAAHFSKNEDGLTILNLLYIDIPCRGNGIASHILQSLTNHNILLAARPSPFRVINNSSFNKRFIEVSSSSCFDKDYCLVEESKDKNEIEKLRNFYFKNGFQPCEVVGSNSFWVTNFKTSIPSVIHILQ